MTTNEIKTLIQNTIAGQGSQVDIGGKLAGILSAIVDAIPSGEIPRPIVLSRWPQAGDHLEDLAEIGLTREEIQAAAAGKRTGIVTTDNQFFPLTDVGYESDENFYIAFYSFYYADNSANLDALAGCVVRYYSGVVTVSSSDI